MSHDHYFDMIRLPILSEKSMRMMSENNQYVFEVSRQATRTEVKQAIELAFGVTVDKVNILNQSGKTKRTRFVPGRRRHVKKAYVTLVAGQTIPEISLE